MIEVALDGPLGLSPFTQIFLERDMSLNRFRRQCSKTFKADIITIFLMTGQKATDTTDIREAKRVIASPYFVLHSYVDFMVDESRLSCPCTGTRASTSCQDIRRTTAGVEIISHPNSGKTMFIQSFVHETPKRERNQVIQAVFRKSIDIDSSVVDFTITDTTEGPTDDFVRRVQDKQVVLLCISKERLISMGLTDAFAQTASWVHEKVTTCRRIDPQIYVAAVVTKYDIMSEFEDRIEAWLVKLSKGLDVFKVSLKDDALGNDLKTPSQVFNLIAERLLKDAAAKHKQSQSTAAGNTSGGMEQTEPRLTTPGWMQTFSSLFSCMSGRC